MNELVFQTNFSALDWLIVAVYMLGTVAIGIYVNRYVRSMADYVVAGRALKSYLAIATMIGTELGLVTVMYAAQKGFTGGFAAFHIAVAAAIVTLIVGLTGFIVVPLRKMGVMTIPEFYDRRFGRGVRVFGGIILAFSGILNMGMFLKAGALFVTGITGMTFGWQLKLVMTVLLGLVLLYTILGGMISVVITDYVQFVVLSFGLLATCAFAVWKLGWGNIVETVEAVRGEAGFNPLHEGGGFGADYVIWMFFLGLVSCAVWQTAVLRACSAVDTNVVKKVYRWSAVGFLVRMLIPQFLGICALTYFWRDASLKDVFFPEGGAASSEVTLMAMPIFLGRILPIGVIGIITAGMLAAFMSTHDSYLLCWSSVLTQDVVAPVVESFGKEFPTRRRLLLARVLIFLIGIFLLVWGLWYPLGQDLWDYMAITGALYFTGAFSLLLMGLYWKRASSTGAYLGLACGFGAIVGLKPVQELIGTELSSARVGLATVILALALMVAGSLLFPDRKKGEEPS